MRVHRGLLFWGLGLVTAGAVALAIMQGYLDRETMAGAWRLWPLILVAIGVSLIVARTRVAPLGTALAAVVAGTVVGTAVAVGPGVVAFCGGSDPASLEDHTGTFAGSGAALTWRLDCGDLDLTMNATSTWTARVGSSRGDPPMVSGSPSALEITSQHVGDFLNSGHERWEVVIPQAVTYDAEIRANAGTLNLGLAGSSFSSLALQPNAADLHLNLVDASVDGFDLELNAGSAKITVSSGTLLTGSIDVNAGSISLCAPDGTPLQITASGAAFGTDLGGNGLTRTGDTWESPGYASAQRRITLTVHGNAASFDLNPSGGCS